MPTSADHRWLHRFALLTAAATLILLVAGGLVTSRGVGMAVPDWPNTRGYNMFLFPVSEWVGGVFYEHSHRLVATLVGLLTAALAVWLWAGETRGRNRWLGIAGVVGVLALMGVRKLPVYVALAAVSPLVIVAGFWQFKKNPGALRWLGVVAFAAVVLQGVLGGFRVVWLTDQIGILHATLAQLFFALTCAIALFTSRWWTERGVPAPRISEKPNGNQRAELELDVPLRRRLVLGATLLILGQLILGATMRHQHAGLAIPDFPLAYGKLWPALDADSVARYNQQRVEVVAANAITAFQIVLQMAHRLLAVGILISVGTIAWRVRRWGSRFSAAGGGDGLKAGLRRLAVIWLGLILVQIALGAWTIWSNKAADVATAHVLAGALSLVTGVLWCIIGFRRSPLPSGLNPAIVAQDALRGTAFADRPAEIASQ